MRLSEFALDEHLDGGYRGRARDNDDIREQGRRTPDGGTPEASEFRHEIPNRERHDPNAGRGISLSPERNAHSEVEPHSQGTPAKEPRSLIPTPVGGQADGVRLCGMWVKLKNLGSPAGTALR